MASPIAFVSFFTAEVPAATGLGDHSWMLSGFSSYHDLKGFVFLADGCHRGPSLGQIFEHVMPLKESGYWLELGVSLPDLFPNLGSSTEYTLEIETDSGPLHRVCFSNVMARLRYEVGGEQIYALIPRAMIHRVRSGEFVDVPKEASPQLLRTFATARFRLKGETAEDALDNGLDGAIPEFIELLNRALRAIPFVLDGAPGRVFPVAYSRASFERFYFILMGDSIETPGHGWVAPHMGRALMNPLPLSDDQAARLRRMVSGADRPDDVQSLMCAARSFLDGGVTEYVLLLIVVAAEVATRRYIHGRLAGEGVGKGKLSRAEKDITYSMMLNVLLAALAPAGKKPELHLLGQMNRARELRNNYMHRGLALGDKREVAVLYDATKSYLAYLGGL